MCDKRVVRCPKLPQSPTHIGDTLEAREYEMVILVAYLAASRAFIIEHGRSQIINGFCSGLELCKANSKWWSYYRTHFADYILARDADIASLCHFPDPAHRIRRLELEGSFSQKSTAVDAMRRAPNP
jgi:hypothetical protein